MFVRKRRRPRAGTSTPPPRPKAPKFISWTTLALLTVGSVGNLGSAPPLAVLGLASVFLYVLPALVFLVPVSLVAAELASGWPGGVSPIRAWPATVSTTRSSSSCTGAAYWCAHAGRRLTPSQLYPWTGYNRLGRFLGLAR